MKCMVIFLSEKNSSVKLIIRYELINSPTRQRFSKKNSIFQNPYKKGRLLTWTYIYWDILTISTILPEYAGNSDIIIGEIEKVSQRKPDSRAASVDRLVGASDHATAGWMQFSRGGGTVQPVIVWPATRTQSSANRKGRKERATK